MSEEKQVKTRNLGRADLISIAFGQIIGVGIMAMTGTAIGMTGRSVNLAFIIAGLVCIAVAIPQILVGGTARFHGGEYTQVATFGGQRLAGIYTLIYCIMCCGASVYILSFTEYLLALVPNAPSTLIAILVLTFLFLLNIRGAKQAAALQIVMCAVMAIAIAMFIAFGMGHIQPGYFDPPDFMTHGVTGVLTASAYLSFAAGGATCVVNLSGEAKNPTKDIPWAIILPTICISIIYALVGTIAGGVLPVEEVANKSLALVADAILPKPLYIFFIVGAAMFALLTTLNASIGWMSRPLLQAAKDGWLPKFFAVIHPRYGTPVNILILIYIVAVVPVLLNLDFSFISTATVIANAMIKAILCFSTMRIATVMPDIWKKSRFHVKKSMLYFLCLLGGTAATIQVILLLASYSNFERICNLVVIVVGVIYTLFANRYVKLEVSYEEC